VGEFAFAPDMSLIMQEESEGSGLNNKLYWVNTDGSMELALRNFERARSPTWSSDGRLIAFVGTADYSDQTDGLLNWSQIESRLLHPWDLYLMEPDSKDIRILIPDLGRPYLLKWSPMDTNLLSFAGHIYDEIPGIWILDTETLQLTRIWNRNADYDWSPDGRSVVIIAEEGESEDRRTLPVIVDLPSSLWD
jgi:Tol biopolymer transport system component